MRNLSFLILTLLLLPLPAIAQPPKTTPGNRLAYLDELDPYYPHARFPKLITPQWVGEEGVDAVVILAIDDMKDPKRYETFLRPILNRLKKIDGRASVSIMTCSIDPQDPQLQAWLKEGLSIEVHTVDHPCPYFRPGFDKAKDTYDRCVDLMNAIPNNKPVCFRMPCCDSMNTPSPRHWAEIFNKTTAKGNYLSLDSSVFQVFTSDDPELPKDLVLEDGKDRFTKYLPMDRDFVNWIENYPYPYVIGKHCWQFPCMTPSDWQAQHLHKPNNPITLRDWKAALDCTVIKKGVFNMVFHPHGWIKAEQIIDLIDHAVEKHGKKVKFMTFKEAEERLTKNVLLGQSLRHSKTGKNNGAYLADLNSDGYLDVILSTRTVEQVRMWNENSWSTAKIPPDSKPIVKEKMEGITKFRFGLLEKEHVSIMSMWKGEDHLHLYHPRGWVCPPALRESRLIKEPRKFSALGSLAEYKLLNPPLAGAHNVNFRDFTNNGFSDVLVLDKNGATIYTWSSTKRDWIALPFTLPPGANLPEFDGPDTGLRFLDLDGDGKLDIVFSNEREWGVYHFTDMKTGWKKVRAGKAGDPGAIPMVARNGKNNGCWADSGHIWWANEDTHLLKNFVDRRSFKSLLEMK